MKYKKRGPIQCSKEDYELLMKISRSQTESARRVRRAKIFIKYIENKPVGQIGGEVGISKEAVYKTIDKALAFGPIAALEDLSGRGVGKGISDEARAWVISLACQSPKDYGYAHELWTMKLLADHVKSHCKEKGFPTLQNAGKSLVHGILNKAGIKPYKIRYYLEKRDEEFDRKMADVLAVYKEIQLMNEEEARNENHPERKETTISYDEKPGIQAIKNISAQLLPIPGKYPSVGRDYEYRRLGTLSLLAGIDLHSGRVIPLVEKRHRSKEFIEFLKKLSSTYPEDWTIRIVLDNHSSHKSKETMEFLETMPGKFRFVFTPKHGSWLNLIEVFFSKIARGFLRGIRVDSIEELKERIYSGIEQSNKEPVVFKWKYKMEES
ncbi:MAG: IS630 family transposase [Cryomorphaceae bacterium]|nr:IS630 family transposase [Cryomorphaceae bacterium]